MPDLEPRPPLSETELEIMRLVATGATNREIARARTISEATVKKHLTNINAKLSTGNRTEAMRRALELGLVSVQGPLPLLADDDADGDAEDEQGHPIARRLAAELEGERRRHRRARRWYAAGALMVTALSLGGLWWTYRLAGSRSAVATATPGQAPIAERRSLQWNPGGRLRSARTGLAIAYADGIYVIGGQDASGVLRETLRLERGLVASWSELPPKPTAARDISAAVVGGQIVVPGGCDALGRPSQVVEIFDTERRAWRRGPDLPRPACAYGLAVVNGRIYLFGGRTGTDPDSASDEVWSWAPTSQGAEAWRVEPRRMARPRYDLAVAMIDDEVHVLGGRDDGAAPQRSHWIFSPLSTGAPWSEDQGLELPEPRAGHAAAGIGVLRQLYVFGGTDDRSAPPVITLDLGRAELGWVAGPPIRVHPPRFGAAALARGEGREIWLAGGTGLDGDLLNETIFLNLGQLMLAGQDPMP
jgi:DNA-binding CsgD family transcriptional regulator